MSQQKAVTSNGLMSLEDALNPAIEDGTVILEKYSDKRRDVSIEYIAVLPNDSEEEFQSQAELISWLTNDCADVSESLEDAYNNEREGRFDENDLYLFKRENAIEFAENLGYRIHDVLKWRKL